jgi:hypothetical protein
MALAFVVSGVVHQWIFSLMTRAPATECRWMMLFTLQPLLIVLQDNVLCSRRWNALVGWHPGVHWFAPDLLSSLIMTCSCSVGALGFGGTGWRMVC